MCLSLNVNIAGIKINTVWLIYMAYGLVIYELSLNYKKKE